MGKAKILSENATLAIMNKLFIQMVFILQKGALSWFMMRRTGFLVQTVTLKLAWELTVSKLFFF